MNRTCYLHIGLHKTGSSAIQTALKGYQTDRHLYAPFRANNHSLPLVLLFSLFRPEPDAPFHADYLAMKSSVEKQFGQMLQDDRDLILSGESASTRFDRSELEQMRKRLSAHFGRIQIIVYARPFLEAAVSHWQQRVKNGYAAVVLPHTRYRDLIQPFQDVFGRENVNIRCYKRERLIDGDIVPDFLAQIGVADKKIPRPSVNHSLSAETTALAFVSNIVGGLFETPLTNRIRRSKIARELAGFGHRKMRFADHLAETALASQKDQIAWIENILQTDMVGQFSENAVVIGQPRDLLYYAGEILAQARAFLADRDFNALEFGSVPSEVTAESTEKINWSERQARVWSLFPSVPLYFDAPQPQDFDT